MRILKINGQALNKTIKEAVRAIRSGQILVCPTDTIYGLICDATNKGAVKKLSQIKKRPKEKPIPIFVKDIKMAKGFANISQEQEAFLRMVWPGQVTAVLQSKNKKGAVGIRIPNHKLVLALIKKLNRPLAESSVNISGKPPARSIKEILKQFKNNKHQPDLILDGGRLKPSKPSLVIDLTKGFKILRS